MMLLTTMVALFILHLQVVAFLIQLQPSSSRIHEEQDYSSINTSIKNSTSRRIKAGNKKKKSKKNTSPTPSPTTTAPTAVSCEDNPNRFYVPNTGGNDMRTCDWVNRKPGLQQYPWRCRDYPEAAENCKVSCGTCPTPSPTDIPSLSPTITPAPQTDYCTYDTVSCDDENGTNCVRLQGGGGYGGSVPVGETSCSELTSAVLQNFTFIAGTPGSELLNISCLAHEFETVDLGFDFQWLGGGGIDFTPVNQILVDTNGQINLNLNNLESKYCHRTDHIRTHDYPRVAIALSDYHPESYGDIVVCKSEDSIVVSFEEVNLALASITNTANAQAQLFADGRVTVCFGESSFASNPCAMSLVSGIEGGVNDPSFPNGPIVGYTIPDIPFNIHGRSYKWPEPGCYLFVPGSDGFVKV